VEAEVASMWVGGSKEPKRAEEALYAIALLPFLLLMVLLPLFFRLCGLWLEGEDKVACK
jgi:hypothetical protein